MSRYILYRDAIRANTVVWQDATGKAYNGAEVKVVGPVAAWCFRRIRAHVARVWHRAYQGGSTDVGRRIVSYLGPGGVCSQFILRHARRPRPYPEVRFAVAVVTRFVRREDGYGN